MRTYTGTYTVSGVTYRYNIQAPDALVYQYSNRVYLRVRLLDSDSEPRNGREVKLRIISRYDVRYTDQDGWAVFDISRFLQITTNNLAQEPNLQYVTNQLALTTALNLLIYDGSTLIKTIDIEAANGADDTIDNFWNEETRRLRWFTNYPFTFDFQNINGNWGVSTNGGSYSTTSFPYVSTTLSRVMARLDANSIFNSDKDNASVRKKTVRATITMAMSDGSLTSRIAKLDLMADRTSFNLDKRCYLRWIGKHGEVLYWLFDKHSVKEDVSVESSRMAFVDNLYNGYGILEDERKVNYTKATSMTIYSRPVDDIDYATLKSIINSPFVDMLVDYTIQTTPRSGDSRTGGFYEYTQWQRVKVDAGTYTRTMKTMKNDADRQLILTLSIPSEGGLQV